MDLVLNNLPNLICHKTQQTKQERETERETETERERERERQREISIGHIQSCYYVHFSTSKVGKGMNPFTPSIYGLN